MKLHVRLKYLYGIEAIGFLFTLFIRNSTNTFSADTELQFFAFVIPLFVMLKNVLQYLEY